MVVCVVVCVCVSPPNSKVYYPLIAVIVHHLNGRCSSDFARPLSPFSVAAV